MRKLILIYPEISIFFFFLSVTHSCEKKESDSNTS